MRRCRRTVELTLAGERVTLGGRPVLMGIVNVTPDSFSDGGQYVDADRAVAHALRLVAEGADWLDVGGESTRPGADPVPEDEELRRVLPVIERLHGQVAVPISIDTYKPAVARRALSAGARVLNDVTGFRDPAMLAVAADSNAVCVCMHMRGDPRTMMDLADYDDVVAELQAFFAVRLEFLAAAGVDRQRVVLDPGIGFAKRHRHSLEIFRRLDEFLEHDRPILVGASRKSLIGELTGRPPAHRLPGSVATALAAYMQGAHILRVHDVAAVRDALAVFEAVCEPDE